MSAHSIIREMFSGANVGDLLVWPAGSPEEAMDVGPHNQIMDGAVAFVVARSPANGTILLVAEGPGYIRRYRVRKGVPVAMAPHDSTRDLRRLLYDSWKNRS